MEIKIKKIKREEGPVSEQKNEVFQDTFLPKFRLKN